MERLLPKEDVLKLTGFTYATLWKWMRQGRFPRSVVVGRGQFARVAWKESEIQEWIEELPRSKLLGDADHVLPPRLDRRLKRPRRRLHRNGGE